jgi:hypothetical protein
VTQTLISEMNPPEKKPYATANIVSSVFASQLPEKEEEAAGSHRTRQDTPAKNAHGTMVLKQPTLSEKMDGIIRPKKPPAFIIARMYADKELVLSTDNCAWAKSTM